MQGADMRVLIACEESGRVRRAFRGYGHDAWSCDLLPARDESPFHIRDDVRAYLRRCRAAGVKWDILIAFPPCTHLSVSGARWFKNKVSEQAEALMFVDFLLRADVPRIALENPVSIISTRIRKPDQIIQPWQFGHGETKTTCLWLKNLPPLVPTDVVKGREGRVWKMGPSPERAMLRSTTFLGIADAMAEQWGKL